MRQSSRTDEEDAHANRAAEIEQEQVTLLQWFCGAVVLCVAAKLEANMTTTICVHAHWDILMDTIAPSKQFNRKDGQGVCVDH